MLIMTVSQIMLNYFFQTYQSCHEILTAVYCYFNQAYIHTHTAHLHFAMNRDMTMYACDTEMLDDLQAVNSL